MNVLQLFDTLGNEYDAPGLDDVHAVTEDVWASLVSDEPLLPRLVPAGTPFDALGVWSAAITVSGGWQGTITAEVDDRTARELTATMLAIPSVDEVEDADVADAVGELVNMIGGNLKSLMPGPSVLSLPMVAAGRAAFSTEVREAVRLDLAWRDGPLRVCVHVPQSVIPSTIPSETQP